MESRRLMLAAVVIAIVMVGGVTAFMIGALQPTNTTTNTTTTEPLDDDDNDSYILFKDQDLKNLSIFVPNWEFMLTDGTNVTIEDLKGKWMVFDLMATWCSACAYQNTEMHYFYDRFHEEYNILTITVHAPDTMEMMQEYKNQYNLTWDVGKDTYKNASEFLWIRYLPTMVLIDDAGMLRYIHEGTWRWFEMRDTLNEIKQN